MKRIPDQAARDQAVDTGLSVVTRAPAGSGKTTLLVERFLRLLLRVDRPEEILAITFTRKAAAEMRSRVLQKLKQNDSELLRSIRQKDQELEWNIQQHPDRLKIQTIDSFASSLVKSMPVSSQLLPQCGIAEHTEPLYREATSRSVTGAQFNGAAQTDRIIMASELLALLDNDYARALRTIGAMLGRRDQWIEPLRKALHYSLTSEPASDLDSLIGTATTQLGRKIVQEFRQQLMPQELQTLFELAEYAARNQNLDWPAEPTQEDELNILHWRFIGELLTTGTDTLRKTVNVRNGFPTGQGAAAKNKQRLLKLLSNLRERALQNEAANLKYLPDSTPNEVEKQALQSFALGLLNAAIELKSLFLETAEIDFTELTVAALDALENSAGATDLALALDYRIKHILVDEFQDTSLSQFHLFKLLTAGWEPGDGRTFFAVGDPMQSIYRFRDADVGLFLQLGNRSFDTIALSEVQLKSNFRSAPELVRWFNRVFTRVFGTHENPVTGAVPYSPSEATLTDDQDSGVRVDFFPAHTGRAAEAIHLVTAIQRVREKTKEESIAILVRNRNHLVEILPALETAGIAWQGTDIDRLSDEPVIADLRSLLHAMLDPLDRISWYALLRSPLIGLSLQDLECLSDPKHTVFENLSLALNETVLSRDGMQRILRVYPILEKGLRLKQELLPRQWLEYTWIQLGGYDLWTEERSCNSAESFFELLSKQQHQWVDPEKLDFALASLFANTRPVPDAVQVMTIHKAKGLEFDHVFLPALERRSRQSEAPLVLWRPEADGLLMATRTDRKPGSLYYWLSLEEKQRDQHELARLMYVATTRAIKTLSLSACVELAETDYVAPPAQSLLHILWQEVSEEALYHQTDAPESTPPGQPPPLRRLPADYQMSSATALKDLELVPEPLPETQPAVLDTLETRRGSLIHRALYRMSLTASSNWPSIVHQKDLWRAQLAQSQPGNLTLSARQIAQSCALIESQLSALIDDSLACWLLDRNHMSAESEKAYIGFDAGQLIQVVIDRTFVDDKGVRWIVDYKTGIKPEALSQEDYIAQQLALHRPQLARYGRILSAFDGRPQILAVYFTALKQLREL